ncbi:DNA polymerase III subunit delta [Paenibacillus massiliensis]|uniref:DNA polymerase III subunit delta n=1 Tax=Paenibacillus massiliensis TaxID=225917 RepID=UPI0003F783DF|nr:DNA polymerase III subunit delta [Paenibacillus massiliensis]
MDVKSAMQAIRKGKTAPIYVLYGTEKYQMKQFLDTLKEQMIEPDHQEFAVASYDLADTPIEAVVEEANTAPFLVPSKLITVRDSNLLSAAKDNSKIEHRIETLLSYIEQPAEYSVIVFVVYADKLDERKKLVKQLKSAGVVLHFSPLGSDDLLQWISHKAQEQQVMLDTSTAELLIRYAGTGLETLAAEIDKLCLYAGRGGTVSSSDIEELVPRSTEQNVFVMVEELANLRIQNALAIFYELLKQREEPIKIAALITRQFRIMLQVKELMRQNYSQQQIAGQLSLHPYAVKIAGEQARRFSLQQLSSMLHELAELDYRMKSGQIDKVLGIELLFLKLGAGQSA